MDRIYKVLYLWIIVALALMGFAPVAAAQSPEGMAGQDFVPPRPDLLYALQARQGLPLAGAANAEEAYQGYLDQKLQAEAQTNRVAGKQGAGLKAAPINNWVMVALVNYDDLTYGQIPQPSTENNTDYWVANFNSTHFQTMLFSDTNQWSLRRYFREASDYGIGGGYDLQGDVHDWTALPGTAAQYGNDAAIGVDNDDTDGYDLTTLVQNAADTLDGWLTPNGGWDAYASSGGVLDYFVVVHAGKGQEAGGGALGDDAVWSTRGSLATPYEIGETGYYVQDFVVVSEDAPVGVFVHEMGHLFGLPDSWNPDVDEMAWPKQDQGGSGEPSPAFYDPMAFGCWLGRPLGTRPASMTAWERMQLEWLSPAVWNLSMLPASIYLAQLETPSAANKALKIELPPRTYVSPYSGDWMRGALTSDPAVEERTLEHSFEITATVSAQLRFRQWYDLKPGVDLAYVEVYTDSLVGYTPILTYTGTSGGWVQGTLNLGAYLGQTVTVRFRLTHDADYAGGLGWFLDDFQLVQNSVTTWSDDVETSDDGPTQGSENIWSAQDFPRMGELTSEHYYLAEWRNDTAGFDVGLGEAYNMTNLATGKAEYYRYNPGLLIWYVNPVYQVGDNDVTWHPGEGFLLAIDAHPDPLLQASSTAPWRTRVQMQDATFRRSAATYQNRLTDSGGIINTIGPLPASTYFWDKWSSYPYWDPDAPDNSAKTLQYGVRLDVEGENVDKTGATIAFSIDAANMQQSSKLVDKTTATPGETLEYTIILRNNGIADAHTVVLSDTAPANTTYVVDSYTVSGSPDYEVTQGGGIRWQGTVPLNSPVTITFQVLLDAVIDNGTVIENVAHVYEGTVPEVDLYAETTVESQPCLTSSTKTSNPAAQLAGGVVTYTISLENTGNADASTVITDHIPLCTTFVTDSLAYSSGSGYYDPASNQVRWSGPVEAQVGPTTFITFQVRINEGQIPCTLITNRATIDDGYHPPFDIGANTTVNTGPNLATSTKTVDKTVAAPGEALQYEIYIHNGGNQSASVSLDDLIPENTTYISPSLTYTSGTGSYNAAQDRIEWDGSVGVASSVTIRFGVLIALPLENGTIITNTAPIVQAPGITHTRTVTTTVLSEPRLTNSTKEVASNSLGYGGILTYTITLLNDGTQDANVTMTDPIPEGTAYQADSLSYTPGAGVGAYITATDTISWEGPIAAGDTVTVTFAVSITLEGTGVITNTATVDDDLHEPFNLYAVSHVAGLEAVAPAQELYCGDTFSVPVRVANVADLQGFQVTIEYDPTILQITSIQRGTWFSPASWAYESYDNVLGTSTVAAALLSRPTGLSGGGDLYYLHFRAIGSGTSALNITDSLLSDTPSPSFTEIPHNEVDGSVTVVGREVSGRAFLQGRTDHSGINLVWNGSSLGTTETDGSFSFCPPVGAGQTFTLRLEKNGYLYAQKLIVVTVTDTLTLNDVTLLGGDPIGSQVTVVTQAPCPIVTRTVAGPPDNRVNVLDLTFVGARFGKSSTDADWGPDACVPEYVAYKADINQDNYVNIFDLVLVGNNFGEQAPSYWP